MKRKNWESAQEHATTEGDLEQTQNHSEKSTEVSVEKKSQILSSRESVSVSELIPETSTKNDRSPIATSIDEKTSLENDNKE